MLNFEIAAIEKGIKEGTWGFRPIGEKGLQVERLGWCYILNVQNVHLKEDDPDYDEDLYCFS